MTTARRTPVPRVLTIAASGLLAATALAACGGSSSGEPSGSTGGDSGTSGGTITISGFDFGDPITVAPSAKVTVLNKDSAEHTVTADEGGTFDDDATGNSTSSFTAPSDPGSYKFHCSFHDMHGTLTVSG